MTDKHRDTCAARAAEAAVIAAGMHGIAVVVVVLDRDAGREGMMTVTSNEPSATTLILKAATALEENARIVTAS